MAKRETVTIDVAKVVYFGSSNGWSAATVARKIGKHPRWLSEIKRGRNLPSPEEAAQMCVLLQTTPEEILVKPEDIALVNSLLEQEKGIKKSPSTDHSAEAALDEELIRRLALLTPEEAARVDAFVQGILAAR